MSFYNNPKWVSKTPLLTVLLLDGANFGQMHRMWTEHTAAGQSLQAWIFVWVALVLWGNFYRVITPKEVFARYCNTFGLAMNSGVIISVIWFRYFAGVR